MRTPIAILLITAVSLPAAAHGQARVTRIVGPDGSATESTKQVELIPFGLVQGSEVKTDVELEIGDELRAVSGKTVVVLTCSDTTGVTLEGEFRVVIMPGPGGKTCFLDLFAGAAHVVGDSSTGLGLGEVTAGAKRTHYTVIVSRSPDGIRRDLKVFDGEVEVRARSGDLPIVVRPGVVLAVARGTYERSRITQQQIESAARLYAAVDASRVKGDVRPTAVGSLSSAYQRVLAHPDAVGPRLDLVAEQVKYGATSKATLYQIDRVRAAAPDDGRLKATTAALSVATYTQLGEEGKAAAGYELSLRSVGKQALENALRAYRVDPEIIQRAGRFEVRAARERLEMLRVRARPEPQTIPSGGHSRIVVKVTTSAGEPLEGATVQVSAGGGAFTNSRTEAAGVTDARGSFSVVWGCSICAPRYGLQIEVAKEGFVPARQKVDIRVQ